MLARMSSRSTPSHPAPSHAAVATATPSGPMAPPPPPVPTSEPALLDGSASVSFAPSGPARSTPRPMSPRWGAEGHALVGVGPGFSAASHRAGLMASYPFPITGPKVHPPLLRADTLSRPRLNGWLDRAVTGRVVLVIAEAGF